MVDYVATTWQLPHQRAGHETPWEQEGSQPPLYYGLVAILVAPIDRTEPPLVFNPHSKIGIGLASDNQNMLLHDTDAESFPWRGATLATMVGRLFSIGLAVCTVWLVFSVAVLAYPERPQVGLVAMALAAFNPMFLHISASINNDNLVILFGTSLLAGMLSFWHNGWSWRAIGLMAVVLGLASLTKLSGLTFAPLVGFVIFLVHQREKRPLIDLIRAALMCAGGIFIIAGWWYWRNLDLYGDITGLNVMVDIAGHRPDGFGLADVWAEREGFYYAFWGWFGGLNVLSPLSFFYTTYLLVGLGVVGLGLWFKRTDVWFERAPALFLLLQSLVTFGGVIRWTLQTPASQGRLLFPAIAALSTLIAIGLVEISQRISLKPRWLLAPLAIWAAVLPIMTIRPAYIAPNPIDTLPNHVQQVDAIYGSSIRLVGYHIDSTVIDPATHDPTATITLYWQPLAQTSAPLSFYVQVFAPDANLNPVLVGKLDSYPSRGLRRTDTWEVGNIYPETYHIELDLAPADTPFQPRFKIGWRDNMTNTEIIANQADGAQLSQVIGRGGRVAATCDTGARADSEVLWVGLAELQHLNLPATTVMVGESLPLVLDWRVLAETPDNYTLFVQLIRADDPTQLFGSGDAVPRVEWYPTSAWAVGSCWRDTYQVLVAEDTPTGEYRLMIGWYNAQTGQRVPVRTDAAQTLGDAYLVETVIRVQ